mmetsp:Transcript_36598/g.59179  ORF Transcript_36598/g.59179 Transcript_36598/m.59179 type:complete len:302 (+) Transcript_36598:90-995(+)|eukprot:CAMPEP_0184644618 /NCGR_PEP_ID=MMETSP0308-20130426/1312_1 /TAXON_ID=38269 /ORGANISM="Gloeochaete witrockiana, Strain SAG 46.84" /LENGTH=301 /DNA_ID=CAMNT_0027073255 /DNA_START=77 /DNA_END=982 /DNA_ORIENTATION=+
MNDTGLRCTFNVMCTDTSFGETVCVVGDCEELGEWRPEHSLRLHTTDGMYPLWSGYVYINGPKARIEYKCGKMRSDNIESWNWESFDGNRVLVVNDNCSEVVVSHTWSVRDAYQVEENPASPQSSARDPNSSSQISSSPLQVPSNSLFKSSYDPEPPRAPDPPPASRSNGRVVPFFAGTLSPPISSFSRPADDPGRYTQSPVASSGHRIRPRKSHSFSAYLNRSTYFLDPIAEEAFNAAEDELASQSQRQSSESWRWHNPSDRSSSSSTTKDDTAIGGAHTHGHSRSQSIPSVRLKIAGTV